MTRAGGGDLRMRLIGMCMDSPTAVHYLPSLAVTFHTAWMTPAVPPCLRTVRVTVSGVLPLGSATSLVRLPGANSVQKRVGRQTLHVRRHSEHSHTCLLRFTAHC